MNVSIQRFPDKLVFAAAHRGPYNTISAAFARLHSALGLGGISHGDCLEMVALYHDDPELVPAAELRSDAGVVVRSGSAVSDGLHPVSIPAGLYARVLYQGPYERLGDAWARFMGGWLVSSGRRLGTGPAYERYLNTPMDTAPDELQTELYVSLAEGDGDPSVAEGAARS